LRGLLARQTNLILIREHGLRQSRRRLQPGHLKKPPARTGKLRLDKTSGIGGRIDDIAGCAAACAEAETIPLRPALSICDKVCPKRTNHTAVGDESGSKNTARLHLPHEKSFMTDCTNDSGARRRRCSGCETEFDCNPFGTCWCQDETLRLPMPAADEDCLCRDCLCKAAQALPSRQ